MSEVLKEKVTSNEGREFSRRRVAKGVAWSVPVIVTAIAAPAAAASPPPTTGKVEVLWDIELNGALSLVQATKESQANMNRAGNGPRSFYVRNTTASGSGAIKGSIKITPKGSGSATAGIWTFPAATLTNKKMDLGVFSADFALDSGVSKGSQVPFPMTFYYTGNKNIAARDFSVEISFTSPAGLEVLVPAETLKLL